MRLEGCGHPTHDETPQSLLHAATTARIALPPKFFLSVLLLPQQNNACSHGGAQGHRRVLLQPEHPCWLQPQPAGWQQGSGGDKPPRRAPAIWEQAGSVQHRARGGLGERRDPPRAGLPEPGERWLTAHSTARPAAVGDAGPSLTHIPSFGWRFLFFPSPGAPINIPEPADIRAGADPCDAGRSRGTSYPSPHPDPSTPELLPTSRHQDTSKPARLVRLEPKGTPLAFQTPPTASQHQAGTALPDPLPRRHMDPKRWEQSTLLPPAPRKGVLCTNHPAGWKGSCQRGW